ncbi:MAG: chemotaxis protein [Clostridiales bacterium]|jgi:two-component system chemotaxis response regulator CheV|nr:chemotaxis protein [Clostridiales bacterium]
MAEGKSKDILLESGTNELEIMEFTIDEKCFGINVAKIKEILQYTKVNPMPNSHPCIEGVFRPRDTVITVVNLPKYMGFAEPPMSERDILIITNFNKIITAFHVHTIEGIHRISWEDIEKPDTTIYGGEEGLATGIAKVDGKLITIIDFEKILVDISPASGIQMSEIERLGDRPRNMSPLLIAEDSALLKKMIMDSLTTAGYTNVVATTDGKEAWEKLEELKADDGRELHERISCIVTDIEMPKMDGHRLTKLIKEDPVLKVLPVVIFSSLIDEEMRLKGEQLGASAQISKPEIGKLVGIIDGLLEKHFP